ncbi:ribosomal protein S27AE [Ereboglobus sp. PH5-5]|uniref:hypothetical protein n=1 Tax=Ereboglobus sp. PH5-5 TaxID=2940529 RepID=UPI0024058A7F|nr:hypothetical protein [Ereboglobus sp. PH5-5]MDF9833609.1 ribosomal protein S27AE [Ereboglobus sp. PH5-5]
MAFSLKFSCGSCGFSISGWDEGNPYVEHPPGKRTYCYHPAREDIMREVAKQALGSSATDEMLDAFINKHSGNAPAHLCLDCGHTTLLDPGRDGMACGKCNSSNLRDTFNLTGAKCPRCGGTFSEGAFDAVS